MSGFICHGVRERYIQSAEIRLRVLEAGEQGAPVVVLAHGFPELAYSWRHQLSVLADAGYHVLAPDMRGYGGSSRPPAMTDYSIIKLMEDLLRLAEATDTEKAVFIGHDWGSVVVWQLARRHPDRVRGVVGMSVPLIPGAGLPDLRTIQQRYPDDCAYMLHYQAPGVADTELALDTTETMQDMFADKSDPTVPADTGRTLGRPEWLSEEELNVYISAFTRTGFTGALNWYRNLDRNYALAAAWASSRVQAPSLFIAGTRDMVLSWCPIDAGADLLTQHKGNVLIAGAGHWVQQEKPHEVNNAILSFLNHLDASTDSPRIRSRKQISPTRGTRRWH